MMGGFGGQPFPRGAVCPPVFPEAEPSAWAGAVSRLDAAFLAQDTQSVADVVVWGALFPVLQDEASLSSKREISVSGGGYFLCPHNYKNRLLSPPQDELQALRTWFQTMTLSEACRKAADSVLMPKGLLEFKSYLQKQPPPCLAMERATSNEPEVQPCPPRSATAQEQVSPRADGNNHAAPRWDPLTPRCFPHRRRKLPSGS